MGKSSHDNQQEVLRLERVRKSYNVGLPTEVEVLHGLDLRLQRSDFAALVGASGSGKSTLLNLIGLLDTPTSGEILLLGEATTAMDDVRRTAVRGHSIGFVFQFHHLIQAFTALENVLMPLIVAGGKPTPEQRAMGEGLLQDVGLKGFADRRPDQLSGGQQQRVAVARALVTRPALLLADEPTGNLDSKTADDVFALFRKFNREFGCAVLLVTHDPRLSSQCDRTVTLTDGRITADTANPRLDGKTLPPSGLRP
ncbi:ABC transporter ATP-binding protein [Lysobacter sp. A03]|uniref:ABC transporter ATP-binding protein n=1 Tax=Lysobacter sp. A03 TaxID=1199154 RepID=UPI0005B6DF12|nr:ABC transporter ATP-binding protein [Lysobacter sp. A03]KIQ97833.1 Lipoprotein releasing system ATP-binding protein LolD [Lysobacter sp. A03]